MAEEPNGHESNGQKRLNRIERALELMLDDHILFREEHKHLLTAQLLLTGSLEKLSDDLRRLTQRVDGLTERVDKLAVSVTEMRQGIDQMREHFDMRLRRVEG